MVDEAVHGAGLTVHVLVDQARDEVRGEGDHKGLQEQREGQGGKVSLLV